MFSASGIIRRAFHSSATNYVRRKANPGIGIQTQVFQRDGVSQNEDEYQDFEELETDFMNVDKTHKEYEREMQSQRERIRHLIVKNKYFKEKYPNFLTYAEKEQIKFLHSSDPEEWTIEKLTESFPTSSETIRKIVRAKWVARSAKRIKHHDEAVMDNWVSLRQGGFPELSPTLREHLTKFAYRKKEDLQNYLSDWNPRPALPRPNRNDFLSLITSCKGYEDKEPDTMLPAIKSGVNAVKKLPASGDEETFLSEKVTDKRDMRLKELKELKLKDVSEPVPAPFDNPSGTGVLKTFNSLSVTKYASDEIVVTSEDIRKYEMTNIKDKIYIPQKLRKKGATYKIDDCYYDDDGEFLYRVPGMTGKPVQH